jgi:hypothetical protein
MPSAKGIYFERSPEIWLLHIAVYCYSDLSAAREMTLRGYGAPRCGLRVQVAPFGNKKTGQPKDHPASTFVLNPPIFLPLSACLSVGLYPPKW